MDGVDCSVVILNWNKRHLLKRSLEALHGTLPSRYRLEIIVVDNGSIDGSQELVKKEFPMIRLIENGQNLGIAQGKNVGLLAARGEFVLLLDDDTTVYPWQLDTLMETARKHPEAGIVTCMKVDPAGKALYQYHVPAPSTLGMGFFLVTEVPIVEIARAVRRALKWGEAVPHEARDLVEIPFIGGAIMLARARAIQEVGLLDSHIFFYGEDFDWCYRFRKRGWKILYVPKIRVLSGYGLNAARTKRASLLALRSRRYLFEKHVGRRYLPMYIAMALTGLLPKLAFYAFRDLRHCSASDISVREWLRGVIRCIAGKDAGTGAQPASGQGHVV